MYITNEIGRTDHKLQQNTKETNWSNNYQTCHKC